MDSNNNDTLTDPAWKRAYRDSEAFRASGRFFWLIEVMGAAILGAAAILVEPADPSKIEQTIYPVVGVVGGLIAVYCVIVLWNLMRAPYRQRDEVTGRFKQAQQEREDETARHLQAMMEIQAVKPRLALLTPVLYEHETLDLYFDGLTGGNQISRGTPTVMHGRRRNVKLWRIVVQNAGDYEAEIRVKLEAVDPSPPSGLTGVTLHRRDDNPSDRISYRESFPIGPQETLEYDCLAITKDAPYKCYVYKTGSLGAAQELMLQTGQYVATIVAYPSGGEAAPQKVTITVNLETGELDVVEEK